MEMQKTSKRKTGGNRGRLDREEDGARFPRRAGAFRGSFMRRTPLDLIERAVEDRLDR